MGATTISIPPAISGALARVVRRLPGMSLLRVLSRRRSLIYQMARRDFTQRFVGSAAGWLWTIIHPLVLLVSWVFVFQFCMKIPPPAGAGGTNYTLYLFCGYLPWLLFQDTVQRSATSLLDHSNLITKTVFPSEIIPLTIFLSSLGSHIIAVLAAVATVRYMNVQFSVLVLLLPIYTFLLGLFTVGMGWIFASLQVYLRDTAQMVVVALTGWFWFTPIFIDETHFPARVRFLVDWNPMAHVVKAYRQRLLTTELPSLHELLVLAAISLTVFAAGGIFFRHLKRGFADVL